MPVDSDMAPTLSPGRRSRGGWYTKIAVLLLWGLMCAVVAEVGARAFWFLRYHVPFSRPDRILYAFYPELWMVDKNPPTQADEFYDILLLGESVLLPRWGAVEQDLIEQLAYAGHRNVRIFNLAGAAHTSRDSWIKYTALRKARFEMVIVYHGINETRTNNAPPGIFREDYSHYSWYEVVSALAPYHGTSPYALPYTIRFITLRMRQILSKDRYVPTHGFREEWGNYGKDPRSAAPFRHHLTAILDQASQRGERMLLMTFATHVPENYTLEAFKGKRLDYGLHLAPVELWGHRENVLKTVAAHNEVVRSLVSQHKDVAFVDQASLMAGSSRYFNDPCHLTVLGSSKFVEHLLGILLPILESDRTSNKMGREISLGGATHK